LWEVIVEDAEFGEFLNGDVAARIMGFTLVTLYRSQPSFNTRMKYSTYRLVVVPVSSHLEVYVVELVGIVGL
jgi:hypothetical protein